MVAVQLLVSLAPGYDNLARVRDDNVVAAVVCGTKQRTSAVGRGCEVKSSRGGAATGDGPGDEGSQRTE